MPHTLFLRLFRTTLVLNQLLNCILYLDGSNKQQRRPFFEAQRGGLRIVIVLYSKCRDEGSLAKLPPTVMIAVEHT